MPSRKVIDEFLAQRRIALVGVSRNPKEFPNTVFRKLKETGHEVVPVNPNAEQIEGTACYPSVRSLPAPVDGVLVMLPPEKTADVVRDCLAAGVSRVWLYKASPEASSVARQAEMSLVEGVCPHMFLGGFPHSVHRVLTRIAP